MKMSNKRVVLPPIEHKNNQYNDDDGTLEEIRKKLSVYEQSKRKSRKNLPLHEQVLSMNPSGSNRAVLRNETMMMETKNLVAVAEETNSGAALVTAKVMFSRMGTINTKMERFDCQAFTECSWQDDRMLEQILDELQLNVKNFIYTQSQVYERVSERLKSVKYDADKYWSPRIYVENAIGELKEEMFYKLELVEKQAAVVETQQQAANFALKYTIRVFEMKFIKGVFYERLELYDFPLDCQELSIKLTSQFPNDKVKFIENTADPSGISTSVFLNQQEWDLFNYVKCSEILLNDTFKKCTRAGFSVSAFIARKPGYYINNAYTLIFLITVLGFVPFSVDLTQPNARATVAGVLILTQVNFRWIVTQRIPSVPYLTSIDKYAIGNLLFLVFFACWHSIVGSQVFDNVEATLREEIDRYVLYAFAGLFSTYTLVYVIWIKRMQMVINRKKFNKG